MSPASLLPGTVLNTVVLFIAMEAGLPCLPATARRY
jgi:hypothetical protein